METARAFLNEGAPVAITGRNSVALEAARQDLAEKLLVLASDAAGISGQKKVAETLRREFERLDVLFLNAGIVEMAPLEERGESAFDRSFKINFKGPFFLTEARLPVFNNPASIVLMTSINSHIGMPNSSVYGATQGARLSLAHTLSGELISGGIRLNAISAGPIVTPLYRKPGMGESELKSFENQIPAKRLGNPRRSPMRWSSLARMSPHLLLAANS